MDFAVIVAVPAAFAVTTPEELTVATLVLLLDQVVAWVAVEGEIAAVNCLVPPTTMVAVAGVRDKEAGMVDSFCSTHS